MKRLIVVAGPTAAGKTAFAIRLATQLNTEIISCDSRQFYREMRIGVARPTKEELTMVPHHFIANRSVTNPYNIYDYWQEATIVLDKLFAEHDTVVAVGGSGLYIDALRFGVSRLPSPTPELRSYLQQMPLEEKQAQLRNLDPIYYARVDRSNPVRIQRALEVCLTARRPYSTLLAEENLRTVPYDVEMHPIEIERTALRERIEQRVDTMIATGLLDEVRSLSAYRHLNTLQTVGYRELFPVIDGASALDDAVVQIKLNTWHYARKQMSWLRRSLSKTTL